MSAVVKCSFAILQKEKGKETKFENKIEKWERETREYLGSDSILSALRPELLFLKTVCKYGILNIDIALEWGRLSKQHLQKSVYENFHNQIKILLWCIHCFNFFLSWERITSFVDFLFFPFKIMNGLQCISCFSQCQYQFLVVRKYSITSTLLPPWILEILQWFLLNFGIRHPILSLKM